MTQETIAKHATAKAAVTIEQAVTIGKTLAALPPKPKAHMTALDIVATNKAAIIAAKEKGYSFIDIAQILVSEGVKISASTLAHYMREPSAKLKPPRMMKPKATEPAGAPAPVTLQPAAFHPSREPSS